MFQRLTFVACVLLFVAAALDAKKLHTRNNIFGLVQHHEPGIMHDICMQETLNASCGDSGSSLERRSQVIIIRSARYGRMRIGRCVRKGYDYLGCAVDVRAYMDTRCSGRHSCTMRVPDDVIFEMQPCLADLTSYLEISYDCIDVAQPGVSTLANTIQGTSKVTAISELNDQLFVAHEFAQHVSVYDTTSFLLQRQLRIPELGSHVLGLAACPVNNVLYVSDYNGRRIHKVDLSITSGDDIVVSTWRVSDRPNGLSINRARNVLVARHGGVDVYDPSGSRVRTISNGNKVVQAVELDSGLLAISRTDPVNSVATMSVDGQVMQSYGDKEGLGLGQMAEPSGIAVDSDGFIFVADFYKHQILVVNPSLTASRPFPLPANANLRYPRAVSLDESRGRLYVGEYGGQRRVLIVDNVNNTGALFFP